MSVTQINIIGTGLTALTLALKLQQSNIAKTLPIQIALIDKARAPGGRLTSRTITLPDHPSSSSSVTVEPGARVFQSSPSTSGSTSESGTTFEQQCEEWQRAGLIRQIPESEMDTKCRGVEYEGPWEVRGSADVQAGRPRISERWWEAGNESTNGGGWSVTLIKDLVEEIKQGGGKRTSWYFNTTVQPASSDPDSIEITFDPPAADIPRPDIMVYTTPSPQTRALLPSLRHPDQEYRKNFALIYPNISAPDLPVYWRNPHRHLYAISTGRADDGSSLGLVLQASPEDLGLSYDRTKSDDETVRAGFERIAEISNILPSVLVQKMKGETKTQLKRWKFAQVEEPPNMVDQVRVMELGKDKKTLVIVAGDGESVKGGVQGSWESGQAAGDKIITWLESRRR